MPSRDDDSPGDGFDDEDRSDDDVDCVACPHCGVMIYEESLRCPACGDYVTFGTGLARGGLWWWTAWLLVATILVFWLLAR